MFLYHGTNKLLTDLGTKMWYTTSINDAAAWAKIKCDETDTPVSEAHIYKVEAKSYELGSAYPGRFSESHYFFRWGRLIKVYPYHDLRKVLDNNGWGFLHLPKERLESFVKRNMAPAWDCGRF